MIGLNSNQDINIYMKEVVIVAYGRSAIAKAPKGMLKYSRPEEVAAEVVKGVLSKETGVKSEQIEEVVFGCAFPEAEQGLNMSRYISLMAGIPDSASAQIVNRFCASGLQSIAIAANAIRVGEYNSAVAGGVEFMSAVPMGGNIPAANTKYIEENPGSYVSMGVTAENVASKYGITRQQQDEFSVKSHLKATAARKNGKFADQIIPVKTRVESLDAQGNKIYKEVMFSEDEGIRENSSVESLAKLRTVFKVNGTVTAGNSSQTSDGAAAVVLMEREHAEKLGIKPLAKFLGFSSVGVDPTLMGIGPIYAIPKVLDQVGLKLENIGLFELNEAFAAQALACINELGIDEDKVNVNGGAIAMGHPLGCTGSLLTVKLLDEMKRSDVKYGCVSMCVGGGMGAAAVFEKL